MLKKSLFLLVTLLGGAGGLLLRKWQLRTAFEADTGLPIPLAPATLALSIVSLLVLVLFALLAYGKRNKALDERREEAGKGSFLLLLLTCAAAAASALASWRFFQEAYLLQQLRRASDQPQETNPFLLYVFALLTLASVAAILVIAFRRYQKKPQPDSLALLIPAFSGCLWLMVSYQKLAGDPFVTDYIFLLFAIMSGMLGHYFLASHSFQKERSSAIYLSAGAAIYFSMTALATSPFSGEGLLCLAQVLYFAPTLLLLSGNDPSMQYVDNTLPQKETSEEGPEGAAEYDPLKEETP